MINWFNMPDEGLSNGGLFEVKELEVTENGTYEEKGEMYNKVTVNVAGGGGSSDLTTADVIFINSAEDKYYTLLAKAFVRVADDETIGENSEVDVSGQKTFKIVIYKGSQFIPLSKFLYYDAQTPPTITGDIEFVTSPSYGFIVSGDGTITAKGTSSAS